MKRTFLLILFLNFVVLSVFSQEFTLKSPDESISVKIQTGEHTTYSVLFKDTQIIKPSGISFLFSQAPPLGDNMLVLSENASTFDETRQPVLKRFEQIRNRYKQLKIELQEENFPKRKLNLVFRAYNDGVAFRVEFPKQFGERNYVMMDELTEFNFNSDHTCWSTGSGTGHSILNKQQKLKLSSVTRIPIPSEWWKEEVLLLLSSLLSS